MYPALIALGMQKLPRRKHRAVQTPQGFYGKGRVDGQDYPNRLLSLYKIPLSHMFRLRANHKACSWASSYRTGEVDPRP